MKLSITKQRRLWWLISALSVLGGLLAMAISLTQYNAPLRPGLDFIGGTRLQLTLDCAASESCQEPIPSSQVREILTEQGLGDSSVQIIEDYTISIRSKTLPVEQRTALQQVLRETIGSFDPETIQIDTVGPTIGRELFVAGSLALIVAFFGIIVYLSIRFKFDYAFFAILALFHDVLITAGVFAILGLVAGVEVDSLFLVALLTITGFSVNDTVVIYDRVREVSKQRAAELADQKGENESVEVTSALNMGAIVDDAVNQTLGRSINTTVTTLLPLVAIFIFGGETLKYFSLALIIGFILGAYSSIFLASTLLAWWRER